MYTLEARKKNLVKAHKAFAEKLKDPKFYKTWKAKVTKARRARMPKKNGLTNLQLETLRKGREKWNRKRVRLTRKPGQKVKVLKRTFEQELEQGIVAHGKAQIHRMIGVVLAQSQPGTLLTLPGPRWPFEQLMLPCLPDHNFLGVERDAHRAMLAKRYMPDRCRVVNMELADVLDLANKSFTGIWADLCSQVDENLLAKVGKTLVGRSPVVITLMCGREREKRATIRRLSKMTGPISESMRARAVWNALAKGGTVEEGTFTGYLHEINGKTVKILVVTCFLTPRG